MFVQDIDEGVQVWRNDVIFETVIENVLGNAARYSPSEVSVIISLT